jgi:hypothetical protein
VACLSTALSLRLGCSFRKSPNFDPLARRDRTGLMSVGRSEDEIVDGCKKEGWCCGQETERMYCTYMHTSKQTGGEFHMGLVIGWL